MKNISPIEYCIFLRFGVKYMHKWRKRRMDALAINTNSSANNEQAKNIIFSLLDEAIEDYECGKIISEEEMLGELRSVAVD